MICSIDEVENGYIVRRHTGRSGYNRSLGQWVEKTQEDVLERVKKILKDQDECSKERPK